jgi:rod shape-determining protein MreC
VAAYGSGKRYLSQRSAPIDLRFAAYAFLCVALMFFDQRGGWLESVRYGLRAAAYPLELALSSPSAAWRFTRGVFEERAALQAENRALREEIRKLQLLAMQRSRLERDNAELRTLRTTATDVIEKWLPADVIGSETTSLKQRLTVDRGAVNGVVEGQTVIAGSGLIGQSLRVGPWSTEIILLSDPEHAVPVQITRTGVRTLALGTGDTGVLSLPYLPLQSDVRSGDQLVTSGLGGVFPAGVPVAEVTEVRRDGASPLAQVRARTYATLDRDRVVAFVWPRASHPAAGGKPQSDTGGDPTATAQPLPPPEPAP